MSIPYFPMYPDDFEADTAHLSLAEDGAYNRLLRLCWRTPTCKIPSDRTWIFRRVRASSDEDKAVVEVIISEFFKKKSGKIFSPRLLEEYEKAHAAHERRVSAGSKGGRPKSLKTKDADQSNAKAMPKQPEPEPDIEANASKKNSRFLGFDEFWAIWPNKTAKPSAKVAWGRLSLENKRLAFSAIRNGWYENWARAHPDANKIGPVRFIKDERWSDEPDNQNTPASNPGRSGPHDSLMAGFAAFADSEPEPSRSDFTGNQSFDGSGNETLDCGQGGDDHGPILRVIGSS